MTESPAALLRRAAEKMRGLAQRAAGGPWTASPVYSPDASATSGVYSFAHPAGSVASEVVASGRIKPGYGGIRHPGNAVYIAAMHPGVALLIADQWDAIVDDMGDDEVVERGVAGIGILVMGCLFTPRKPWTAAVAAARAFLGEEADAGA